MTSQREETPEQREKRLEYHRQYDSSERAKKKRRKRQAAWPPEQWKKQRDAQKRWYRKYIKNETPEQKEKRLERNRIYAREYYAENGRSYENWTEERWDKHRKYTRDRMRRIIATETPEEREIRLAKRRAAYKRRRELRR